jgi:uncharacterized protein
MEKDTVPKTPRPVLGLYDRPMWESINARAMQLQQCADCGAFQYPPGPACPNCLSMKLEWTPISGRGHIISWAVFHRQYLPAYPAPYNTIAVRLEERPVMISNLEGGQPDGSWIGAAVTLSYVVMPDGVVLPRFTLAA